MLAVSDKLLGQPVLGLRPAPCNASFVRQAAKLQGIKERKTATRPSGLIHDTPAALQMPNAYDSGERIPGKRHILLTFRETTTAPCDKS